MPEPKKINSLYDHFKNTSKKLKIICDWDEVIQACEPYAKHLLETSEKFQDVFPNSGDDGFEGDFQDFWYLYSEDYLKKLRDKNEINSFVEYSPYSSKIVEDYFFWDNFYDEDFKNKYLEIKNSPNFYQQAPFLTIAEDLLKLIKEGKIDRLIFLSAYDKRKFPNGDKRKYEIFRETFAKLARNWRVLDTGKGWNDGIIGGELNRESGYLERINLQLIDFDISTKDDWEKEKQEAQNKLEEILKKNTAFITYREDAELTEKIEQARLLIDNGIVCLNEYDKAVLRIAVMKVSNDYKEPIKADWIKENASDFDLVIDDNPYVCKDVLNNNYKKIKTSDEYPNEYFSVCSPYYPAIENQHDERVLLVKNEVSDLKKEDFTQPYSNKELKNRE